MFCQIKNNDNNNNKELYFLKRPESTLAKLQSFANKFFSDSYILCLCMWGDVYQELKDVPF